MSSTADARDSTPESFSGLLERLTRRGGQGNADSYPSSSFARNRDLPTASEFDLDSDSSFGTDRYSGSASVPVSSVRPGRSVLPVRSAVPVKELKPGKSKPDSDSMPLSYEKALRMHGRHNRTPNSDLPEADEPREDRHIAPATGLKPAPIRTKILAESKRTIQKPTPNTIPDVPQTSISGPREVKVQQVRQAQVAIPAQTVERRSAQPAGHAKSGQARLRKQVKPPPGSRIAPGTNSRAGSNGKIGPPPTSGKNSRKNVAEHFKEVPTAREDLQLERQQLGLQMEHRRAILSIRLSDRESDQLRLRAAESGLSVSAYTRSCVLEAEHLRSQVKQALAEMRTFMGQTEQVGLPALAIRSSASNHESGFTFRERWPWSRILAKSAAALLGLWLPFRRGA
jgi:hypothetical protein